MSRIAPEYGRAERLQGWTTVLAAAALVTLWRYFVLSVWHLWSLSRGRGGLTPLGADDGDYYLRTALDIAEGWTGTVVVNIYPAAMGQVMRLTGITSVFFYKHVNFLAGLAIIAVALLLYRRLRGWDATALPAAADATSATALILLFGCYASAIAYEEFTLTRDGWIYLAHLVALAVSFGIARHRGVARVALLGVLAALLLLLYKLRFYAPAGYVLGVVGWRGWHGLRRRTTRKGAVLAFAVIASLGLAALLAGAKLLATSFPLALAVTSYRSGDPGAGGSSLGIDLVGAPIPLQFPLYVYSTVSNMLGPLPWQVRSVSTAAGFLVEVPMLSFVLWRIWELREGISRASSFLLWQAIAWFFVIGYFNDNLGTAFRLRVLGWHALFVLYAVLRQRAVDQHAATHRPSLVGESSGGGVVTAG